jgi:hypothetical protein
MMNTGIRYKQFVFILKKHSDESEKSFLIRKWFIATNLKKLDFDELVYLSDFYVNVKLNKVKYDDDMMDRLDRI